VADLGTLGGPVATGHSVDGSCLGRYGARVKGCRDLLCTTVEWRGVAQVPDGLRVWCGVVVVGRGIKGERGEKGYWGCLMETSSGRRARREDDESGGRVPFSATRVPYRRGERAGCRRGVGEKERGYSSRVGCRWLFFYIFEMCGSTNAPD
jgi:hypothetical protein